MVKDGENKYESELAARFSFFQWFDECGNKKSASFLIGNGWLELLWGFSLKLEEQLAGMPGVDAKKFTIYEVNEKYGGMRIESSFIHNTNISNLILEAEDKSYEVCEDCGQLGEIRNERSWIVTLCDFCDLK